MSEEKTKGKAKDLAGQIIINIYNRQQDNVTYTVKGSVTVGVALQVLQIVANKISGKPLKGDELEEKKDEEKPAT